MSKGVLVLLSGGIDSSVLAGKLVKEGYKVEGLFINYNQPWIEEEQSADLISKCLRIPLTKLSISSEIKEDSKNKGFVPLRNAILLSLGCSVAFSKGLKSVAIGCNQSGNEFRDQDAEFIDRFNFMTQSCFVGRYPWVIAPFLTFKKSHIINLGRKYNIPLELTKSCLSTPSCGTCSRCSSRKALGVDPQ